MESAVCRASARTTGARRVPAGTGDRIGAVDYLRRVSRLSVGSRVARSRPLTSASRANIGLESARVRNVTERRHTGVYVRTAMPTPPPSAGVADTWERGHAPSVIPPRACPGASQSLPGVAPAPSRLPRATCGASRACKLHWPTILNFFLCAVHFWCIPRAITRGRSEQANNNKIKFCPWQSLRKV